MFTWLQIFVSPSLLECMKDGANLKKKGIRVI